MRPSSPQSPVRAVRWLSARPWFARVLACTALVLPAVFGALVFDSANASEKKLTERHYVMAPAAPKAQTWAQAKGKSDGCMTCHSETDQHTMHANPGVVLGCTDCHGGDNSIRRAEKGPEADRKHPAYERAMELAHILPRDEHLWKGSRNPDREIGTDFSVGAQWRPFYNQNVIINTSFSMLKLGQGLKDLYGDRKEPFYSGFINAILTY